MSYGTVPGPRTTADRRAIASVADLMAQGEVDREDELIEAEERAAEDAAWQRTHGGDDENSPSMQRITEQFAEKFGDEFDDSAAEGPRVYFNAKVVRYHDEVDDDLEDVSEPLRTVFDDETAMDTFLPDLPDSQHEHQRQVAERDAFDYDDPDAGTLEPQEARAADEDGYDDDGGEYEPRRASEPPVWIPPDQR